VSDEARDVNKYEHRLNQAAAFELDVRSRLAVGGWRCIEPELSESEQELFDDLQSERLFTLIIVSLFIFPCIGN
jgi:hypothetical protein